MTMVIHAILQHALLKLPSSIAQLITHNGVWFAVDVSGKQHGVTFHGSSVVTVFGCVINLSIADQSKARTILLIPSRVDEDAYRRLKVILLWCIRNT